MPYKTIIDNLKDKQYWCINNSNIGNEGAKYLAKILQDTQATSLDLTKNSIGNEGAKYLAQTLQNTKITNLNLSNNNIGDEGAKYLAKILKDTQITSLNLTKNSIGIDGAQYLNQVLNNNTNCSLFIDVHYTEDYGVKYIHQYSFHNTQTYVNITLNDNSIGIDGAQYLNQTFKNIPIADLNFDSRTLEDDDVQYLAKAFKDIQIAKLTLCNNHIMQTKGIEYLVTIFKDSSINQLYLGYKKLYTTGAKYLASFLKEVNLINLNLNCNYIGDEGVKYLAPSLKNNTIMHLDLGWNNIEANGAKYLAEILSDTQIIDISLCNNSIGVDGAKYLANGLKYSQVTGLHLHGNDIEYEGYQYLIDAIDNTNISWVNLHHNNIEKGLGEETKFWPYSIPRDTTTIAYKIRNAFKELVSLNPLSNEFEFIVPRKNAYPTIELDQYVFLIKTLNDNSNFKVHIFDMYCKDHDSYDFNITNKITEFIKTIADKFNIFINDKLPALTELFSKYNYVNLVKQFEDMKYHDIVKNLLLHRALYYVDDRQEILHPYIYKMLHKYGMILYNVQIEPNKKDEIISYYQNHLEIDGVEEIIDLLGSESFQ